MSDLRNERFEVRRLLGAGAMGCVYAAYDQEHGRDVAVKVLATELRGSPEARARFRDEFLLLKQLAHPRIVRTFDFGEHAVDGPYITMEVLAGPSLAELAPVAPVEARRLLAAALEALGVLHTRGFVHGDVRPENFRLDAVGELRLVDLGLAIRVGDRAEAPRGTPLYMAPEIWRAERVDGRADLYALGATFYHLLAGRPPFTAADAATLARAHQHEAPAPPTSGDEQLAEVVSKLLAKAPIERPATANEALRQLGLGTDDQAPTLLVPSFVGRSAELAALHAAIADGERAASPRCYALVGAVGAGKTRTLEALAAWGQTVGLDPVLLATDEAAASHDGLAAELARRLAPRASREAVASWRVAQDSGPELEPLAARARRHQAWAGLIRAIAGQRPLVLLIDGWEAADAPSRALIDDLCRREGLPLVVVVAMQAAPSEIEAIELGPLDTREVGMLAAEALGQAEIAPSFAAELRELAQGSPGDTLAWLAEACERGAIPHEAGRWRTERARLSAVTLPATAAVRAQRALEPLSPTAWMLAEGLAIAGLPLQPACLAAWLGLDEQTAAAAIGQMRASGLVRSDDRGARIASAALAAAIREGMSIDDRRTRHAAIAEGLAGRADEPELAAMLARHRWGAGQGAAAIEPAMRAASQAIARYDLPAAEELLRCVLAEPALDAAGRALASELAGDVARMRGAFDDAVRAYQDALTAGARPRARVSLGIAYQLLARFDEARRTLEEAEAAARAAEDARESARALAALTRLHHLAGRQAEALAAAERGLAAARAAGDLGLEAEQLGFVGLLQVHEPGRQDAGLAALEASLALRERLGDPIALNDGYMLLGNALLGLGRLRQARAAFERSLALAKANGAAVDDETTALINMAHVEGELSQLAPALEAAAQAVRLAADSGNRFLEGYARALRGRLAALVGRLPEASSDAAAATAIAAELANAYLAAAVTACNASVLLSAGDLLGVLEAQAGSPSGTDAELAPALLLAGSQAYMALGDPERARLKAEAAAAIAAPRRARLWQARAAVSAARAALTTSTVASARRLLGDARMLLEEVRACPAEGEPPALAWLELRLAEAALAEADGPARDAAQAYHEVLAAASACGALWLELEAARGVDRTATDQDIAGRLRALERRIGDLAERLTPEDRSVFLRRWRGEDAAMSVLPAELSQLPLGEALERLKRASEPALSDVVVDFGRMVTGTLRYEEVLDRVIEQVMAITDAERAMIMLVGATGELSGLVVRPAEHEGDASLLTFSRTFVDAALREGRSVWAADAQADERFSAARSVMALDLRTVICVPLVADGETLGLLYLDRRSVNRSFREADLRLVEGLAAFAASAIANARSYESTRVRARLSAAIQAMADLIGAQDLPAAAAVLLSEALAVSGATRGILVTDDPRCPAVAQCLQDDASPPEPDAVLVEKAALTGQVLSELSPAADGGPGTPVLVVPLMTDRHVFGVLQLARDTAERAYTPAEIAATEAVARQATRSLAAIAEREAAQARIKRLEAALALATGQASSVEVDPLTGLSGPSYFIRRLDEGASQASRHGDELTLLVVDPAGIGTLNETFGRPLGDQVLCQIGAELLDACRRHDVVARIGGDEFALMLPATDMASASGLAERLAERLRAIAICDAAGEVRWRCEPAIASVAWESGDTPEQLLERALTVLSRR